MGFVCPAILLCYYTNLFLGMLFINVPYMKDFTSFSKGFHFVFYLFIPLPNLICYCSLLVFGLEDNLLFEQYFTPGNKQIASKTNQMFFK